MSNHLIIPNDPFIKELLSRLNIPFSEYIEETKEETKEQSNPVLEQPLSIDTLSTDYLEGLVKSKVERLSNASTSNPIPSTIQSIPSSINPTSIPNHEEIKTYRLNLPLTFSAEDSDKKDNKVNSLRVKANREKGYSFIEIEMVKSLTLSQWNSYLSKMVVPKLLVLDKDKKVIQPLPLSTLSKPVKFLSNVPNAYTGHISKEAPFIPFLSVNTSTPSCTAILLFDGLVDSISHKDVYTLV
jgi:hypothetical protein